MIHRRTTFCTCILWILLGSVFILLYSKWLPNSVPSKAMILECEDAGGGPGCALKHRQIRNVEAPPRNNDDPISIKKGVNAVIIGNPRSGTTFVSTLMAAQSDDAVYWFEPAWKLGFRGFCNYEVCEELTDNLLSCGFPKDTKGTPIYPVGPWSGASRLNRVGNVVPAAFFNASDEEMHRGCKESPLRVIKYVRLKIMHLGQMLEHDSSIRGVYLVRDPRAVALSQLEVFFRDRPSYNLTYVVTNVCRRQMLDAFEYGSLSEATRERILVVKYEDLVKNPTEEATRLYAHLGLDMSPEAQEFIESRFGKCRRSSNFSTCAKGNATEIVNSWRKKVDPDVLTDITNICKFALESWKFNP